MKNLLSLIAIFLMISCDAKAQNPRFEVVGPEEFKAELAKDPTAILLDVRKADEYAAGHIAGASLLDWLDRDTFEQGAAKLDTNKTIFVYCRSGRRSAEAAGYLAEHGFNVVDLNGGILAWEKEGLPIANSKTH